MRTGVVVVGGGQAGLAMGYHLARQGQDFVILDAAARVGDAWRSRWDSLRLFTPRRYSALPGMPMAGDPEVYAGKDEVADYLEAYASRFGLPVRAGARVDEVRAEEGAYVVETAGGRIEADVVVVATGPFQRPAVPSLVAALTGDVLQLHSSAYRSPAALPEGNVLVVGAGNSGVQIAEELAATHPVTLAVGGRMPRLPERVMGRSLFWWLEWVGAMDVTAGSALGRRMSRTETLIGSGPAQARRRDVALAGRVVETRGDVLLTSDGHTLRPRTVIWATGFRPDYGWLRVPVLDARGVPVHRRGMTAAPGLCFLGLSWMHTRGSALIGWVGRDAAYLAEHLSAATPHRTLLGVVP